MAHKKGASCRGIDFELSLSQWKSIWKKALGDNWFSMRGTASGKYVMARLRDRGPYAVGNVKIILHSDNVREGVKVTTPAMREASRRRAIIRNKSAAQREACSRFFTGRKLTEEHKKKIADGNKLCWAEGRR